MAKTFKRTRRLKRATTKKQKQAYKLKRRQQKYDYNTSLQTMKGKTTRHNVAWAAATAINERQATAQENIARYKANKSYRFGSDIITRTDNDVQPDDQVLNWVK